MPPAPGDRSEPCLVVHRFGVGLFSANAARLSEEVSALVDVPNSLRGFVLVADAVDDIEYTGGKTLLELADELKARGIVFAIAEVGPDVLPELNRFGVTRRIRKDRVLETLEDARGGLARLIATGLPSTRRATAGTELQRRRADAHRAQAIIPKG